MSTGKRLAIAYVAFLPLGQDIRGGYPGSFSDPPAS